MVLETRLLWSLCIGLLCRFHTEARHVQFDDHAVMHEAVDRCGGRQRVLEDLVPFAEGKVARQKHAPAFAEIQRGQASLIQDRLIKET